MRSIAELKLPVVYNTRIILLFACIISSIFWGLAILSGEQLHAYDAPTHIFFAKGYYDNYWSMWDDRWYGGFNKSSYPPLSHQLVALLTHISGNISLSYSIILWIFLAISPIAIFRFARSFSKESTSIFCALTFIFLPSIRLMTFVDGQFAGFIGLFFALIGLGTASEYLHNGKIITLIEVILWCGCLSATHTNTLFFFFPIILVVILIVNYRGSNITLQRYFNRSIILLTLCCIIALIEILPFWVWFLDFHMQKPIPHPSRENFFQNMYIARRFFLDYYGPILIVFPILVYRAIKTKEYMLLLIAILFYFILGLGGTTSFPDILLRSNWQWLTYERFNVWATVLVLPLIGEYFLSSTKKVSIVISNTLPILLVIIASIWLISPDQQRISQPPVNMEPIIKYFAAHPECAKRYLVLGFGYQLPDFATYSNGKTLDGLWHTARTDPLLRGSGIGALDNSIYYNNWQDILQTFLKRLNPYPARCIFLNETIAENWRYKNILKELGWTQKTIISEQVTLWGNNNQSKGSFPNNLPVEENSLYKYIWGIAPLFCLLSAMIISIVCKSFLK